MPTKRFRDMQDPAAAFITTTVTDWLPVFSESRAAREVALQLSETARLREVSIVAYVVMPSHIHALLGLPAIEELSGFVQAFKSLSSRRVRKLESGRFRSQLFHKGRYTLWKRRFDDVIIVSETQFRRKVEYIHQNPVRAELVRSAVDWVFSSAREWILGERGLIEIDRSCSWLSD